MRTEGEIKARITRYELAANFKSLDERRKELEWVLERGIRSCLNCDNDKPAGIKIHCAYKLELMKCNKPLMDIFCCLWENEAIGMER